jgi:hypothetical protein
MPHGGGGLEARSLEWSQCGCAKGVARNAPSNSLRTRRSAPCVDRHGHRWACSARKGNSAKAAMVASAFRGPLVTLVRSG